ncbi:ABC transporter ATP-binding protein [Sphingobium sp. CR28]|uniref:ABC transporter ATP-binding protein n=1 Tax=Sphingobium sp. CR28 TaxID=3400272 RepID=UPI003FEF0A09
MHGRTDASHIAIDARDVTLSLGAGDAQTRILKGVSLSIPRGESLAILGPSGSGKSSLMAILSGLERATSGEVTVAGIDFARMSEDALARARRGRIGIILQSFHLLPTMTALENVAVPLELAGIGDASGQAGTELEAVGLSHRLHHYPSQLSGGEQQRVAIARAVAPRPPILFADEPTGNLDSRTSEAIVDVLFDRRSAADATLVMITHDLALARRCDRIVEMRDGEIVSDGRP